MEKFSKIFETNGKKDTPFFENFPKEIHRIANFGSVAYRPPSKSPIFPRVAYKGRCL